MSDVNKRIIAILMLIIYVSVIFYTILITGCGEGCEGCENCSECENCSTCEECGTCQQEKAKGTVTRENETAV